MKTKQVLFHLLFLFAFGLSAQSTLWRISGKGLKQPSYLFGTIHIQNKSVFELSDSLLPAIGKADYLALEMNLAEINPMAMLGFMMLPQGKTLKDFFTPEEYVLLSKEFETQTGMSITLFQGFKPFSLLPLILSTHMKEVEKADMALDEFLNYYALARQVKVMGIEQVEEQMKVMESIPASVVFEAIVEKDSSAQDLDSMVAIYNRGDLVNLLKMMEEDKSTEAMNKDLIVKRNQIMFERTYKVLKKGNTMVIAVGAGHLPGETGLISLFRKKGYTVEPIVSAKTAVSQEIWDEISKFK